MGSLHINKNDPCKGELGFAVFGSTELFSVVSNYDYEIHGDYFYREKGGFGFWAPSIKVKKYNNKYLPEDSIPNELCFQVEIRHSTDKNLLYMWGREPAHANEDPTSKEYFSGIFL